MDINLVKNVINGVNLVKIGHFCENGQNWVILGGKMTSEIKIWGWDENITFLKLSQKLFQSGLWTEMW